MRRHYYGGKPGLAPGDEIPTESDGRVEIQDDWRAAQLMASFVRGDVYLVSITGLMYADDPPGRLSCEKAEVVRVIKRCVPPQLAIKAIRADRNAHRRAQGRALIAQAKAAERAHADQAGEPR